MRKLVLFTFAVLVGFCQQTYAVGLSKDFNFDGFLADSAGEPLVGPVTIKFQIYNPSETCLLFEEEHTVALGSDGSFSVKVGTGTRSTSNDGGAPWAKIFQNDLQPRSIGTNCAAAYTPAAGDGRKLRVIVNNVTLTPSYAISSVPTATVAETLQGKTPADFMATPAAAGAAGQILSTNGAGVYTWIPAPSGGGGGGTVTSVTAVAPLSVSGTTAVPQLSLSQANGSTNGYLSSTDWSTFNNKLGPGTALPFVSPGTVGNVLMSNGSSWYSAPPPGGGGSPSGAATGDLADAYPNPRVAKIQGTGVSASAPTNGQIFKFNGTEWVPSTLNVQLSDLRSSVTGALFPGTSCATNEALKWNGVSDIFECQAIALDASAITAGTLPPSRLPLAYTNSGGDMSFGPSSSHNTILKTANVDRLTIDGSGSVGIGGAPFMNAALAITSTTKGFLLPRLTTVQRDSIGSPSSGLQIYNTDTAAINYYNGSSWQPLSGGGGGGTVTSITAGSGLSGGSITTSGTLSVAFGTTVGTVAQGNDDRFNPAPSIGDAGKVVRVNAGGTAYETIYAMTPSDNLAGLTNVTTARTNLGASGIGDAIFTATSSANARTALGLGDLATLSGGTGGQIIMHNGSTWAAQTAPFVMNTGNSMGAALSLGTNDSYPVSIKVNGANKMTIDPGGNIGVGTMAPTKLLHLVKDSATTDGALIEVAGATGYPSIAFKKARGSTGSPAPVQSGDVIMKILSHGYHNVGNYHTTPGSFVAAMATEGYTSSGQGTALAFGTTPNGTTTTNEVMRIDSGGSVGIGTTTPNPAAALDIVSTTKGLLVPRMSIAQRDSIASPPAGLLVYNTNEHSFNYYDGGSFMWKPLSRQPEEMDMGSTSSLNFNEIETITVNWSTGGTKTLNSIMPGKSYRVIINSNYTGSISWSSGMCGTFKYSPSTFSSMTTGTTYMVNIYVTQTSTCLMSWSAYNP